VNNKSGHNCKADAAVVDDAITDEQGWVTGQTLERAMAALNRELGRAKK
jgi:hypothetical protein